MNLEVDDVPRPLYLPMSTCPRGKQVILQNPGKSPVLGTYDGDPQWRGWFPIPEERRDQPGRN